MKSNWGDLLLSFLHDPPDKALEIRGHRRRAAHDATEATGRETSIGELEGMDDWLASVAERPPMPDAGEHGERIVLPEGGCIQIFHPLSGCEIALEGCSLDEDFVAGVISELVAGVASDRDRFLLLWRLLPERLSEGSRSWFAKLPADTRVPDHTIWNHLDVTAGLRAALWGQYGAAFLSFSLGPVQRFIESARSVRDLWSGSAILSYLTFQAMLPVIEALGPTAVISPSLRGTPLMDLWLLEQVPAGGGKIPEVDRDSRRAPCIPNRFLAVVPWGREGGEARSLANRCRESAHKAWRELAERIRKELAKHAPFDKEGWDVRWEKQIDSFFEMCTAVLPWRECGEELRRIARLYGKQTLEEVFREVAKVRKLADVIPESDRPHYEQRHTWSWQALADLSSRLMEAERAIRHVPTYRPTPPTPPKCSLMGSYEQMGPDDLGESAEFWNRARSVRIDGVRLRRGERLCAVALVKRFAGPVFFAEKLRLSKEDLRFPDTATIAAALWLDKAGISPNDVRRQHGSWNGQWLHWTRRDFDPDEECPAEIWALIQKTKRPPKKGGKGEPPVYYAVLMMDADGMGMWLRGEKTPCLKDIFHRRIREYFERLPRKREVIGEVLSARRPLGPALHASISEALTNFAVHIVPRIVRRHRGTLIYAGGDDVLALLPASEVLACARELRDAFRGKKGANNGAPVGYYRTEDGRDRLVMGPKATLSAGIAVTHYKEDLRLALEAARLAERKAKGAGRNALQLTVLRRSGECSSALCEWEFVPQVEKWLKAFMSERRTSDRWTYHLRRELHTLQGLPVEAAKAEIRRQVDRTEEQTRILLGEGDPKRAGEMIADAFATYLEMRRKRGQELGQSNSAITGCALKDFITLIQSVSFLARRGRET